MPGQALFVEGVDGRVGACSEEVGPGIARRCRRAAGDLRRLRQTLFLATPRPPIPMRHTPARNTVSGRFIAGLLSEHVRGRAGQRWSLASEGPS